eukprot:XP_001705060.1 Hypothetical protein GL50803_20841 [Giardia lamblia ATCC 50803]
MHLSIPTNLSPMLVLERNCRLRHSPVVLTRKATKTRNQLIYLRENPLRKSTLSYLLMPLALPSTVPGVTKLKTFSEILASSNNNSSEDGVASLPCSCLATSSTSFVGK